MGGERMGCCISVQGLYIVTMTPQLVSIIVRCFALHREHERALVQAGMTTVQPQLAADQARFTGGGFNLRQGTAGTCSSSPP